MTRKLLKTINFLFFLSFSIPLFAQNATFFLSPKWQIGEKRQFELTKGKRISKNGIETTENESRQTVTMRVVAASTKGYIVSARYDNAFKDKSPIEVRYAIGQNGDFQTIVNLSEVRQSFDNVFESLTANTQTAPSPTNRDASTVKHTMNEMRQFMTSDSYITNVVFQELGLIHQFYNNGFTVDSLERYSTQLPNVLNPSGALIEAQATLLARREGDIGYIRHTVEPDLTVINQEAQRFVNRVRSNNSSKLAVQTPPSVATTEVALSDENFCSFDLKTGWLAAFQRKRTILEGDVKTVEFVYLKMIP